MVEFAAGGVVLGPGAVPVSIEDTECLLSAHRVCHRTDDVHLEHHRAGTAQTAMQAGSTYRVTMTNPLLGFQAVDPAVPVENPLPHMATVCDYVADALTRWANVTVERNP